MDSALELKILALYEEVVRREKIEIHLHNLQKVIKQQSEELASLLVILEKEERDVKELEAQSLFNIFKFVLGNKEQQLEKERQEYLQAFLKYRGVEENIAELKEESELLRKTFSGLHSTKERFDELKSQKEKRLKNDEAYPEALDVFNRKIANHRSKQKELEVTIKVGESSQKSLYNIVIGLRQIDEWGSEGTKKSSEKVSRKTARVHQLVYIANSKLQKFEDELLDLTVHFGIEYRHTLEQLETFLDDFIACLITDWIVNNKIENSIYFVNLITDKITLLNNMLEYEITKTQDFIKTEESDKAAVLVELINAKKI